ncbi:MAG: molybdopterin molybdotransferase MoeA [Proteobacteria bacterium]|nr:molybdopterin molybdotransferase MoeA [Pseudomonadota bacterium]
MTGQTIQKDPSCKDEFDPNSLSAAQALKRILDSIDSIKGTEKVPLRTGLDRILCEDIRSKINVPGCTNSAMDGYAVQGTDLPESGIKELKLVGTVFAGKPLKETIISGTCARIMTGGVMPQGTDSVVIQENVERHGDVVRIGNDTRYGDNVRQAGEDIKIGDVILRKGVRLTPANIGLVASLGIGEVMVTRKPRVAFFSTGDELRSIGEKLEDGDVYDSNRYTLHGMLMRLGAEIIDMGVIKDVKEDVEKAFNEAASYADVVITSGGVSVGEADYVKEIMKKIGNVDFWKVAIKPGRPLAFGKINNAYFFGLPGNPVSVMVTFYQFVQPALYKLMGSQHIEPITCTAVCLSTLKKRPGRVEYQRGVLERDSSGQLVVHKTGAQGSGILSSMAQANCFIILPMDSTGVSKGNSVDIQPFFGIV